MRRLAFALLFPLLLSGCVKEIDTRTRYKNVNYTYDFEKLYYVCEYYENEKLVKDWNICPNHTYYSREKPMENYKVVYNEVVESTRETYLVIYNW